MALALSGCGAFSPPATSGTTSPTAAAAPAAAGGPAGTVARADRTHEVPTPARPERVARGWPTPEAAVRAFAIAYINWTAATVGQRLQALARSSVGQARAMLALQAHEVAADTELRRGRIANSGTVEAVAPLGEGRTAGSRVDTSRSPASARAPPTTRPTVGSPPSGTCPWRP